MTITEYERAEYFLGPLIGTVHIQFSFFDSPDSVHDEYFPPTTLHGRPCAGNNPQEAAECRARARRHANDFIAAASPFAKVWEVV